MTITVEETVEYPEQWVSGMVRLVQLDAGLQAKFVSRMKKYDSDESEAKQRFTERSEGAWH